MNKSQLAQRLVQEGFRRDAYVLDGTKPPLEALVLKEDAGEWIIAFCERGLWRQLARLPSEDTACERFYELISSDPTAKMPVSSP